MCGCCKASVIRTEANSRKAAPIQFPIYVHRWYHIAVCAMNGKDLSLALTDTHNQDQVRANHSSLHTYIHT